MKVNILGVKEGMYMVIDLFIVEVCLIDIYGDYIMEVCGLWCIKGDFMGGLFVLYICLDKVSYCIIIIEVFIYLFDKMKCDLMC